IALGAPREAHALADAAIERAPAPPGLYLLRAEAARYLDRLAEAAADYEQALATGLPALIGLAKARQLQGDYAAARALLERALAQAQGAQRARILSTLARLDLFAGEMAAAEATAREAVEVARAAGNQPILAQCLTLHGLLRFQRDLGAADEARAVLEEALAIGQAIGDRVGQGMAHDALGNLAMALGDLPRAAEAFARFGEVCRQAGLATEGLMADLNAAIVAGEAHDASRAEALAVDVAARARAVGRRFVLGAALAVEGQARWLRGADAGAALDEALQLAEALKNAVLETLVRMIRLEVAMGLGRQAQARQEADLLSELVARTGQEEAAGRLDGRRALLFNDAALARARTTARDQVAAHLAWQALAKLEGSKEAAQQALAIARRWSAPAHIAADRRLLGHTDQVVDPIRFAQWMEDLAAERDKVAELALTAVLDLARCTRGYVLTYEGGRLSAAVTMGLDYAQEVEQGFSRSIAERALFSATPLYVVDAGADDAWRGQASVLALGLRTVLALPLAAGDRLLGVLYADREDPEPLLAEADVALLAALAAATAALLAAQREAQALDAAREAQARCAALARALHRTPGRDTLLAAAREAVNAEGARWLERPWPAEVSHSIADHVAETGRPLCLLDASGSDEWQQEQSVLALGLKTVWCLPVPGTEALLYLTAERVAEADGLAILEALAAYFADWGP
ncbi:MAG: hypothetical protein JWM80_5312, partial [Cyanobacteria bacterium RYN_339]|nr:hypothetical protein [Cyanobacteria bacterium RYN_339]